MLLNPPFGRNEVRLDIAGVVYPIQTSDVCLLISVVGGARILFNEVADVIFGVGLDAVFGFAAGLVVLLGFLAGLGWAFFGVVLDLWVTLLCKHEMSLCTVLAVFAEVAWSELVVVRMVECTIDGTVIWAMDNAPSLILLNMNIADTAVHAVSGDIIK